MIGRRVAQYQILDRLGVGGMGEIFKAQDTRLNRFVAIKVLPHAKADDPERRKRFLLEAQTASGLNHPGIITIHDIISEGDSEFMVMEFVAGKTLNDLIPKGGLRVYQALAYSLQIADALTAAHNAGIVHRDLKPANIMINDLGLVKVLDFGLAKLTENHVSRLDSGSGGTTALTVEGSIVGTVNYMSPEQAQGKKVDARSDIFSFGVVLYEMLTGQRAFEGDSSLSTLTAILRDDVKPMSVFAPDIPLPFEEAVQRCLRKNPDERPQTMREVQNELLALKRESDTGSLYSTRLSQSSGKTPASTVAAPPVVKRKVRWQPVVLAVLTLILLVEAGAWFWMRYQSSQKAAEARAASELAGQARAAAQAQAAELAAKAEMETLTNDGVLRLVAEKIPVGVILDHIRDSKETAFDLSTAGLISLTKGGVPPLVIDQMRQPKRTDIRVAADAASNSKAYPPATRVAEFVDVELSDGMPVKIALTAAVPANADLGRPVRFTVVEELRVRGVLAIPKGAAVDGQISETPTKKGLFGIGNGKLNFTVSKVETAGVLPVTLRAVEQGRTKGLAQRPVEVPGKHGAKDKEIVAVEGTEYTAYVDGAQTIKVPRN